MAKGRKRLPAAMRRCDMIHARVTPSEREAIKEMAADAGMTMGAFIHGACFAFAGKSYDEIKKINTDRLFFRNNPEGVEEEIEEEPEEEPKHQMPK